MSEEQQDLLQFIYQVPVGVAQLSLDGSLGITNPHLMQMMLQISPGTMNIFDALRPHAPELELLVKDFQAGRGTVVEDYRVDFGKRSKGSPYQLVVSFTVQKLGPERFMLVMDDVSRSVAAFRAAEASRARLEALTEAIKDYAVVSLDEEGQIQEWPKSAQRVFGFSEAEAIGQPFGWLSKRGRDPIELLADVTTTGYVTMEAWWNRGNGAPFWAKAVTSVIQTGVDEATGYLVVVKDHQPRSHSRAAEDSSLLPRVEFECIARRIIESGRAVGRNPSVAMITCDVPQNKSQTSRESFESVAQTVREHCEPGDELIRYGDESLLVVMEDANIADAKARMEAIRNARERCLVETKDGMTQVTLSIGVCSVDANDEGPQSVLARAEAALAEAVERGCNQVVIGHPGNVGRRAG